ncbi:MAG: DNA methyltransferase, partial [Verrucomicrobiota bacterium]
MGNTNNPTLFKELDFNGIDKNIYINKTKFLEIISQIQEQPNLAALKENIYSLKQKLSNFKNDQSGLLNISSNGDTLTINQKYLYTELKQIVESQSLERSRYYLQRLKKSLSEYRTNKHNDLNLNRWKEYTDIFTDSLWLLDKRDNTGSHTANYWGNFVPQIPYQLMRRYTKKGEWVLDTFAGCGTTAIEAQRLGRNSVGIEIQPDIAQKANALVNSEPNNFGTENHILEGNSIDINYSEILNQYGQDSVQLLIMHPPYFDIIKFSENPQDLSNATSVDDFLDKMKTIVTKASEVLDKDRYFALVIGDKYSKGEWIPLGFFTMQKVLECGFKLKSIIVKNFEETAA